MITSLALLLALFTAPCPPAGCVVSPSPPRIVATIYLPVVVKP
jgi:hypothetical protein